MGVTSAVLATAHRWIRELGHAKLHGFQGLSRRRPVWPNRPLLLTPKGNPAFFCLRPFIGTFGPNRTKPCAARANARLIWLNCPIAPVHFSFSSPQKATATVAEAQACFRITAEPLRPISTAALTNAGGNNTGNLRCLPCDFDKSETRGMA